jgi:hypothetical protein
MCWSCGVDSTDIGADFFKDGKLDISMVDTSTVVLSTILIDDINSNGSDRLIVGSHADERLGRITAIPFMKFTMSGALSIPLEKMEYNSMQFVFETDGYARYDTTTNLSFSIHRLSDDLESDNDGKIYVDDFFSLYTESLGQYQFLPKPNRTLEIMIPLSDHLGRTIFEKVQQKHNDLSNNSEFIQFFKGLALVPDSTMSSALLGLKPSMELRVYYYDHSSVPSVEKYISFSLDNSYSYTCLINNRQHSELKRLSSSGIRVPAFETNDESYLQGGSGLAFRVDLPHLRTYRQHPNFYLTRAILEIYPVRQSFNGQLPLPLSLSGYRADESNRLYNSDPFFAALATDYSLGRDTFYEVDVTSFVKEQMDLIAFNENALIFISNANGFNTDRLCIASPSKYSTRLKIYYATINN